MLIRKSLLSVHRWVGLTLGLLLVVQGLTGGAIMFGGEIERIIHPELIVSPGQARQPVQAMLQNVRTSHPDKRVVRVNFPADRDGAVLFQLTDQKDAPYLIAVDPYRNLALREGALEQWPVRLLTHVHEKLLAGDIGAAIVGFSGIALLFMAITGPIVWWPGRARIREGLRVRWDKGAGRGLRQLHRTAGAIGAAVLVVSAATGALMAFKDEVRSALRTMFTVVDKPAPKVAPASGRALLPVDELIRSACARYGPTALLQIRFPGGDGRAVTIFLAADESSRPEASKQISFNGYTGAELGHYNAGTLPASNEFIDWLYPIHTGRFLGTPGRALFLVGGLLLAGLSASGIWLWLSRNRQRRVRRAKAIAEGATDTEPATIS